MALPEIRVVRSHPVALDQCRRLLASLPEAAAIAAGTTADAAAQVARDADPTEVAIASELAAALHGLVVLAADVGDHPEAFTRFVAISNRTQLGAGADWRIAFSFQTDHRPGALHRAIEPFARHALDLVQLTSRPIPQTPWRYRFDAVVSRPPARPGRLRDARRGPPPGSALHRLRLLYPGVRELSEKLGAKPGAHVVVFFTTSRAELEPRFEALKATLDPADGLWIAWPKKASKLETDLDFDAVQSTGLAHGLVDNKSCAIDERWQALRFVYRLEDRPQE